ACRVRGIRLNRQQAAAVDHRLAAAARRAKWTERRDPTSSALGHRYPHPSSVDLQKLTFDGTRSARRTITWLRRTMQSSDRGRPRHRKRAGRSYFCYLGRRTGPLRLTIVTHVQAAFCFATAFSSEV